jgi:hypothetical protein
MLKELKEPARQPARRVSSHYALLPLRTNITMFPPVAEAIVKRTSSGKMFSAAHKAAMFA